MVCAGILIFFVVHKLNWCLSVSGWDKLNGTWQTNQQAEVGNIKFSCPFPSNKIQSF